PRRPVRGRRAAPRPRGPLAPNGSWADGPRQRCQRPSPPEKERPRRTGHKRISRRRRSWLLLSFGGLGRGDSPGPAQPVMQQDPQHYKRGGKHNALEQRAEFERESKEGGDGLVVSAQFPHRFAQA